MASPIRESGARPRRPVGVRLYLAIAFAAVALITAALVNLLFKDSSTNAAAEKTRAIAAANTQSLANRLGKRPESQSRMTIQQIRDPGVSAWVFDEDGNLLTDNRSSGVALQDLPIKRPPSLSSALRGSRSSEDLSDGVSFVAQPVLRNGVVDGAVFTRAEQPKEIQAALDAVGANRTTATVIAVAVAILLGALMASLVTTRVKRLAEGAARITAGGLDEPLHVPSGRDEISDLGRALESMRRALLGTFDALSSERDRLSAIFDALGDALMVVGPDGEVRFSNPAAQPLIGSDKRVPPALVPWLRRAEQRGAAEHDGLRLGEKVYAVGARRLAAEGAVLAVVRDRTDELRRELAEREFVSNAAHELRNPMAGISGAIEVLQAGAKDDLEAREHFLRRLSEDADRVSRLTESLLVLARIEAVGEGGAEALDVGLAIEEAAEAVSAPDGIEIEIDAGQDVAADGDRVLLRQVLVGLLTNAFKNTPPPGVVRLSARLREEGEVLIEVTDTGTGIAEDEVSKIFDRFYRGTGSLEQEGFGLGLSIARRMVDVMGGEIGVSSTLGEGSTFWIRLPAAKPAATPVA